jgi:hypothetical protein
MSSSSHFPLLQLFAALAATAVGLALYRITSINTFIDHRKNILRSVFREVCEVFPDLILLIQNIGKTRDARSEVAIVRALHPSAGSLAEEIQRLRSHYNKLKRLLVLFLTVLAVLALIFAFAWGDVSQTQLIGFALAILVWLMFIGSFLRLERHKELEYLCLAELLDRLARRVDEIRRFAQARRRMLHRDALQKGSEEVRPKEA